MRSAGCGGLWPRLSRLRRGGSSRRVDPPLHLAENRSTTTTPAHDQDSAFRLFNIGSEGERGRARLQRGLRRQRPFDPSNHIRQSSFFSVHASSPFPLPLYPQARRLSLAAGLSTPFSLHTHLSTRTYTPLLSLLRATLSSYASRLAPLPPRRGCPGGFPGRRAAHHPRRTRPSHHRYYYGDDSVDDHLNRLHHPGWSYFHHHLRHQLAGPDVHPCRADDILVCLSDDNGFLSDDLLFIVGRCPRPDPHPCAHRRFPSAARLLPELDLWPARPGEHRLEQVRLNHVRLRRHRRQPATRLRRRHKRPSSS